MADERELEVRSVMARCRHFTGIQNDKCGADVNYRALVGGDDFGWALAIPCLGPHKEKRAVWRGFCWRCRAWLLNNRTAYYLTGQHDRIGEQRATAALRDHFASVKTLRGGRHTREGGRRG